MQGPGPSLGSPAVVGPQRGPVFCFVGTVHLLDLLQTTRPGSVIGHLNTAIGVAVPLVQSSPAPLGSGTLATLDRQLATVCGNLLFLDERLAVDVAYVSPGTRAATPGVSPLALVAMALLGLLPAVG
ncbi:MAG: hypothetical protein JWN15_70 [Firmicutes bacterium]|nr:hypothetical protein [Bacillota bacterium]